MKRLSIETAVGIFVLIGIVCVGYLTIRLGEMEWIGDNDYPLYACFQSVSGLKTGVTVEMAGVQIGRVDTISLDPERQIAVVKLKIRKEIILTDDVIASVKTSGLIGDKYIALTAGGSDLVLKPGDMITETESAVDLEELISKYAFGEV
ncbi:MAG: outer membrane lipid asymmetry maintenance protein MlaD [Desulfobacterales bacterium C00003060]|nr:MAG: outer membrane lipid asymmetry maintenance protein MlaD [Desulfobacterales bacterium S3730MH5]OEU76761.1 MAG: outer membrane lipid asymmetry maintenance protein MlaD [Desulfobacterales bacterium C00003060]OEU84941.1 MAG: outer membrane lipid asymmetry maintenance protein MlaD [Desulfobacterales bacterium S5133MH4]